MKWEGCNDTYVSYDRFIKSRRDPLLTKNRILDTAERVFAENSFHGVSFRAITSAAKVNLAAVHYHFGDKECLYREVILRRIRPLNALRLVLLAEACDVASPAQPSLEKIITIMAQPLFNLYHSAKDGGRFFVQLIARGLTDPSELTARLLQEEYHPVLARFAQLIRRHVPQLSPEEFMWRFSFVVGALHHTLATLHQMTVLTRGICRSDDGEAVLARFTAHAITTFQAPSTVISDSNR